MILTTSQYQIDLKSVNLWLQYCWGDLIREKVEREKKLAETKRYIKTISDHELRVYLNQMRNAIHSLRGDMDVYEILLTESSERQERKGRGQPNVSN